jgi:U3 small nucleolar RNA-associated protein 13
MAGKPSYYTTFEVQNVIQPIYTGGSVALDQSGRILATCLGEEALITDLESGKQLAKVDGVCAFASESHSLFVLIKYRTAKSFQS